MKRLLKQILNILLILLPVFAFSDEITTDTTGAAKIEPISLTDINYEIGRIEKEFKKIETTLNNVGRYVVIDSLFSDYKTFLENEAREFKSYNPYNLSRFFLENTFRLWEGFTGKLSGWQGEVNNMLKTVQADIEALDEIKEVWELTYENAQMSGEEGLIKERIGTLLQEDRRLRKDLSELRWKYVVLEDDIAEMVSFCSDIISEVEQLQQNQRDSLFMAVSPPIWSVHIEKSDYSPLGRKLSKARHENTKILKNYFAITNLRPFWIVAFLIILFILWMRHRYFRMGFDDSHPGHKPIARIFKKNTILTLVAILLVTFHLMYPYYPLVVNHIFTLSVLIIMRLILGSFINRENKRFILRVIILLVLNDLEIVFWYFGDLARYYLIFESIVGIGLVLPYLRPTTWKRISKADAVSKVKLFLTVVMILCYTTGLIANIFGYLDFTVLITKTGIHVPEFTVILYGLYLIIVALIRKIISVWSAGKNTVLEDYWDNIEKRAVKIAGSLAIIYWFYSLTVALEVSRPIIDSISDFLFTERKIGTMETTVGSIFALILILIATFLLTGVLKIFLEHVIFNRIKLRRGVSNAISVTIRYFLIVLGFLFALSAAGIELGKFSLLAGALGVGIGFGLQNIVNNFISGLILIYERPIQVGDTIEVETLLGQVNRIGLRSSNVRTYDGAEVVVPNSNLISNQLINWTLSDNKRRIEIRVGVSYGSDPNVVLALLEKVAREHEDVMPEPEPFALFEDFGDSSLNFRLLFWVPYELGIRTKSTVAIGIFNIFRENGIEIPFPQLDLHVKENGDELTREEIEDMEKNAKNLPKNITDGAED